MKVPQARGEARPPGASPGRSGGGPMIDAVPSCGRGRDSDQACGSRHDPGSASARLIQAVRHRGYAHDRVLAPLAATKISDSSVGAETRRNARPPALRVQAARESLPPARRGRGRAVHHLSHQHGGQRSSGSGLCRRYRPVWRAPAPFRPVPAADLVREVDCGVADHEDGQTSLFTSAMHAATRSGTTSFPRHRRV